MTKRTFAIIMISISMINAVVIVIAIAAIISIMSKALSSSAC